MTALTGTLQGTADLGKWLGAVPSIRVQGNRPRLRNNGFNCFAGQGALDVPGLDALLERGRGHVQVEYDNGDVLYWASRSNGGHWLFS